jgi:hypothetical protein
LQLLWRLLNPCSFCFFEQVTKIAKNSIFFLFGNQSLKFLLLLKHKKI